MRYADILENIVLSEGRDSPLFHFTTQSSFYRSILSDDALKGGQSGVSLTRSIRTPFFGDTYTHRVLLVLNQSLLSHRFKITPMYGDSITRSDEPQNEFEERIKGDINNLHKYLIAIAVDSHILEIDSIDYVSKIEDDSNLVDLMLLRDYVVKFKIPVVARDSVKDNGTWSRDITKEVIRNGNKVARIFDKENVVHRINRPNK